MAHLERRITRLRVHPDPLKIATRRRAVGHVVAHGLLKDAVIVSDDAGQFNVGSHALCWVHAERLIHKLVGFNHRQRQACARIRARVWWFYADLKAYCRDPTPRRSFRPALTGCSPPPPALPSTGCSPGSTPTRSSCSAPSNGRIIPLHTNGSENDIRWPGDKAQNQRWHPLGDRPRLPRRLPRLDEDLRQARRLVLGLPRQPARHPRRAAHPPLASSSASAPPPDRPAFCPCYLS